MAFLFRSGPVALQSGECVLTAEQRQVSGRMDKTALVILGAGSMAVEVFDIAEACGTFDIVGFLVNTDEVPAELEGRPVYRAEAFPLVPGQCQLVGGMVSTRRRAFVEEMVERGYGFASVIHPSAQISRRARVGAGCLIHPGVIVATNTTVGDHVLVNRGALIGHDNRIEPFTTIGPGANLAGALTVGPGAYLGVGCVVRDHLRIGAGAVVAAGAVVVKDVAPNTLCGGVPATVLRTGLNGL